MTIDRPIGVLFVCTGNICRSPMAEGVFRKRVRQAGLEANFEIDSAGTYNRHEGEPPSLPAIAAAVRRGYDIAEQRCRPLVAGDVERFDYPLAMDRGHLAALRRLAPPALINRPRLFLDYAPQLGIKEVPDPYGLGLDDYERALDLIEAGCDGLLHALTQR